MFKKDPIKQCIADLYNVLLQTEESSKEYEDIVGKIERLEKLRRDKNRWISADVVVPAATNLLGIFAVIKAEQVGVIASKAFSLIKRK